MKACLGKEGTLIVSAENSLESYALKQWWKEYQEARSTLQIETAVEDNEE